MSTVNPSFPSPPADPSLPDRRPVPGAPDTSAAPGFTGASGAPGMPQDAPRSTAADMVTRVVKGAHESIDSLAEHAKPPLQRLEQGLAHGGEALHEKADQLRATGDEWAESLRETVREHPIAALAAALAVGVVIARLTH